MKETEMINSDGQLNDCNFNYFQKLINKHINRVHNGHAWGKMG